MKNINLRINRDLSINVSANKKIPIERIEKFLYEKQDWIKNSINKIKTKNKIKNENINNKYIQDENILILGNKYKLNVLEIEDKVYKNTKNKVEVNNNEIYLYIASKDKDNFLHKEKLMNKFLLKIASDIFQKSLEENLDLLKEYNIKKPQLIIRKMKTRWGVCNRQKQKITINYDLIKTPKELIDYVMLHELIHFLCKGHDKKFYNFMDIYMPNWKRKKKIIE